MDVLGRDAELARIDGWLRAGTLDQAEPVSPSVLVIEGEPGIGKTTLWSAAVSRARLAGWQVLLCRPVPSDAGLPHVGLTDLLRPVPAATFGCIPAPQRRPLAVALLREEAGESDLDPRAVGTGLTALLTAVAETGPWRSRCGDWAASRCGWWLPCGSRCSPGSGPGGHSGSGQARGRRRGPGHSR
jgi:hypothetical protein